MQAAHPAQAGIVDEDVDALVVAKRGRHERARVGAAADVQTSRAHVRRTLLAASLRDSVQAIEAPRAQGEARPLARELQRRGLADAAGRARDRHHRILQTHSQTSLGAS